MTNRLSISKTTTVLFVGLTMVLWSVGLAALAPAARAADLAGGDLIKASGAAVYYYASDGTRYVFPNQKTYDSWYEGFSGVKTITDEELAAIPLSGKNVVYRPGTKLVKITTDPKVYAVEPGGVLRWVETADVAEDLWGSAWAKRVQDLPDAFFSNYTIGDSISSAVYPAGSLVAMGDDTYHINADGEKQMVDADGMSANRFMSSFVADASDLSSYPDGDEISAFDEDLADTSQGGGGGAVVVVPGAGLSVALASSSPATASIVADSTSGDGAQAMADLAHFNFTAASDGAVKVTGLNLTRTGISSSNDLYTVYLYMDGTRIAESYSIAEKVISFSSSAGLFTVPASSTVKIVAKADLSNGTSSGKTVGLSINASSDVITAGGGDVTGSFPAAGANHSTASVSDLGKITLAHVSAPSAVDPGDEGREVWRFSLAASDQKVEIEKLRMTMVGTVAQGDLQNLKVYEGGTQLGATVDMLDADNTMTFDWSDSPYLIKAGETKTLVVRADIVGGTNRSFYFSFQRQSDLVAKDVNYGVYLKPNQSDAFTIVKASSSITINTGKLIVSRNSEPNGKVALNATNVTLASWDLKAYGENVKITAMTVLSSITTATSIENGKLYLDGTQVGSEQDFDDPTNGEDFSFGNTFVIPAGETKTLTIVGDVKSPSSAADPLAANDTFSFDPSVDAGNATGITSLATVTVSIGASNTLTVASGSIIVSKSSAMAEGTSTNVTAVNNEQNVKIGKFVITAGAGEGVEVNQIVLTDNDSEGFGELFNSVFIVPGGADPEDTDEWLGTGQTASTSTSQNYSFDINPGLEIAKGAQYTFDVYASSIVSDASDEGTAGLITGGVHVASVSYMQVVSTTSTTYSTEITGQNLYFASSGTLTATISADTPQAQYMVMGEQDISLAKFKLTATQAEALTVNRFIVVDTTTDTGGLVNFRLYNGSTLLGTVDSLGTTVDGEAVTAGTGAADFNGIDLIVPKGDSLIVTVKADVNGYPNATAGASHTLSLEADLASTQDSIEYQGANGSIANAPASGIDANAATPYRTGLTVTLNANSYSGVQTPSDSDKIAIYNFTADEAFDVTLNSISIVVSGTALPASGDNIYTLRDADGTAVDTTTWTIGTHSSASPAVFGGSLGETIARGSTEIYTIYVDSSTNAFQQGTTIYKNFEITLDTWGWRDGVVTSDIAPLASETSQDQTKSNTLQY